jgi:hypothetical protein
MAVWFTAEPDAGRLSVRTGGDLRKRSFEKEVDMPEVGRISVQEAREKVTDGQATLVCAYEQDEKCNQIALEGAIPLSRFQKLAPSLPKEQEVIFFCT